MFSRNLVGGLVRRSTSPGVEGGVTKVLHGLTACTSYSVNTCYSYTYPTSSRSSRRRRVSTSSSLAYYHHAASSSPLSSSRCHTVIRQLQLQHQTIVGTFSTASSSSSSTEEKEMEKNRGPPLHPLLAPEEVARLEEEAEAEDEDGGRAACRELGMRYLTYGKKRIDTEKAFEWLEKAGKRSSASEKEERGNKEEEAELWYARGLARLKLDEGRQDDNGLIIKAGQEEGEEGEGYGEVFEEQVETETYGAKTGIEFVRVLRKRANKQKRARAKEIPPAPVASRHRRASSRLYQAAQRGHIEAMIQLANLLYENADYKESPATTAAASTSPRGSRRSSPSSLSTSSSSSIAIPQDDKRIKEQDTLTNLQRAVEWYEKATKTPKGHADAWYNLGMIYYDGGSGVKRDVRQAVSCFEQAASLEVDGSAAYWLGHAYRVGEPEAGLAPNLEKALSYLKRAGDEQGHSGACYYLAMLYRNGDEEIALQANAELSQRYLYRAERLGDPDALFCLADMYLHGTDGVSKDENKAMEYYHRAGEAGHADALTTLGALLHARGLYEQAVEVYQRAGELGSLEAWRNLASMYLLGQGVAQNEGMARHILKTISRAEQQQQKDE